MTEKNPMFDQLFMDMEKMIQELNQKQDHLFLQNVELQAENRLLRELSGLRPLTPPAFLN